jgi:hypothetical protein
MSFDSSFYASQYPDATDPYLHYLTTGWRQGNLVNAEHQPLTPDEILQMIVDSGPNLTAVVAGLSRLQLDYLDQSASFDLGEVLTGLDDGLLAGFMAGWGRDELSYLDNLPTFDLPGVMGQFEPSLFMGLLGDWDDTSNLEYLANLDGFDFSTLAGSNPDLFYSFMQNLDANMQNAIYADFTAEDFAWLNGATGFSLAGMMESNFGFFRQFMSPEKALGLFGQIGDNLVAAVRGLDAADLSFLDSADGFDLGSFLGSVDNNTLASFMAGWDSEQLSLLDGLGNFNLAGKFATFDPELMGSMMAGWDDPNTLSLLNALEGFDFAGMLEEMPAQVVGNLVGTWDSSMLMGLNGVGWGNFDPNDWIAGASSFTPA